MRPGPAVVTRLISSTIRLDSPPRPIVEYIVDISLSESWFPNLAVAHEKAEYWSEDVLTRLTNELNLLLEMGRPPRYSFNTSSSYMVQGFCFIEPNDSPELRESKLRRLRSDDYFNAMVDLSSNDFELLCGKVIELIGVDNPVVTRTTADEGIDFYGQLSLGSMFYPRDLSPTIQKQLSIWMVGQAKRYVLTQSGTKEIRELVGSVILARSNAFGSLSSPFRDFDLRPSDPVFSILITTGSISANAVRLLNRSGVIGMDGEMLAAFLADRRAGIEDNHFSQEAFISWILT